MYENVPKVRFKEFNDEWNKKKIGETLKIKHGKDQKKVKINSGKYPILGTGGEIGRTNEFLYNKESVLIGRKGTINKPRFMNTPFWTVDTLFYSEIKNGFRGKFLYYEFQRINWEKYCEATGVPSLSASTIEGIKYHVPSLQEQEKIANFFTIIDNLIEELEAKIDNLKLYKKGMMQQIFEQEIRFKDDNGCDYPTWRYDKLYKYLIEFTERTNVNDKYPVLTSSKDGIIFQNEYFKRQVASLDTTGYKIIPKGYITYRSMSDTGNFTFNIQNLIEKGIISPAYPIFKTINNLSAKYLILFMNNTDDFKKQVLTLKEGGTRYALSFSKLKHLKIKVPCLEEQIKISNFLSNIDNIIDEEEKNLDSLKDMKKGLLQEMFV